MTRTPSIQPLFMNTPPSLPPTAQMDNFLTLMLSTAHTSPTSLTHTTDKYLALVHTLLQPQDVPPHHVHSRHPQDTVHVHYAATPPPLSQSTDQTDHPVHYQCREGGAEHAHIDLTMLRAGTGIEHRLPSLELWLIIFTLAPDSLTNGPILTKQKQGQSLASQKY